MIIYPDPEGFATWQAAFRALVQAIKTPTEINPPLAPAVLATNLPDGVTPGVMFYVANATGVGKLAISTGTGYVNVRDGSKVA